MKKLILNRLLFTSLALVMTAVTTRAQVTLNLDAGARGATIGARHYGIFFEEINHAGDGGLYAELVRNRSFEDNATSPEYWNSVGTATLTLTAANLLNDMQKRALRITCSGANAGVRNAGFWGMNIVAGNVYSLSFWARADSYAGTLTATLQNASGVNIGSTTISESIGTGWKKYTATITATGTAANGRLAITGSTAGTFYLDVVSLFPPTFNGRENGCRTDLAEKLQAMKPSFMRFPGGCYIEGQYADGDTNRFEWKKTIGPIEKRPGHKNQNWGYRVSDGFGYHEMLQLSEDIGAEPLFVVNIGMGHGWTVDYQQIDPFIQEALDAIEYANGDASTPYGAMRVANGHAAPFNLRLMEIGNENYQDAASQQSDHYAERYAQFRKAILEKYPYMTLIGNVQSWGTDDPTWRNPNAVELVDEHYYRNPAWFVAQYNKYDTYSRSNYKVYAGEYAVTSNFGTTGNLNAALGEAVYMAGMENNADVCVMNSYAPIFVNENNQAWMPDMIRFNASTSYGTPSYYIQQLFPNNLGKQNVKWTETGNSALADGGHIGVGTWKTAATFDNAKVTGAGGSVLISDNFAGGAPAWTLGAGTWAVTGGAFAQSNTALENCTAIQPVNIAPGTAYTYEVQATKTGGDEGFLIIFNYQDENNYCWWNLGGWGNTQHAIEQCVNGSKSTLASASGALTTGQTYNIKIEVNGASVKCYLDGALIHEATLQQSRRIYTAANIDDGTGVLYVKLINPNSTATAVTLNLSNATLNSADGTMLVSGSGMDENTTANPNNVVPQEISVTCTGNQISYTAPAYSANILRLNVADVQITETPVATVPAPLVKYSFEPATLTDDSGTYPATLGGAAAVAEMADGNHALYTGAMGGAGYLNLGSQMGKDVLGGLTSDYTVSIDLMNGEENTLGAYSWAYALCNGTSRYIGLINTANNGDWYYEIKGTNTENVKTGSGLLPGAWHNATYVQQADSGYVYLDGYLLAAGKVDVAPSSIAAGLTNGYLGRSPYTADAYMENTYMDNFQFFNTALTAGQVAALNNATKALSTELKDETNAIVSPQKPSTYVDVYDISGTLLRRQVLAAKALDGLARGVYVVGGRKVVK